MTNSACQAESAATDALFVRTFQQVNYIVGPSGQLVGHGIAGS
jgi:L-lactate dehydrogenase complex protein LldE